MGFKNKDGIYITSDKIVLDKYMIQGSIESAKKYLDEIHEKAVSMGYVSDGNIDIDVSSGYYDNDCDLEITYSFFRLENQKEKAHRENMEAELKRKAAEKRKKAAEDRKKKEDPEYAEFQRLKAKFG